MVSEVSPSLFCGCDLETDALVRACLDRYEPVLEAVGTDEYNLRRFRSAAFGFIPILRSCGVDLGRANMLEIGCGRGLKGLAWADLVARYTGIDLDATEINRGREIRARAGRSEDELVLGDAGEVLSRGDLIRENEIDILVLYAVLEHLTPSERQEVFRFARRCYDRGALIVIAETPNRLVPFDHHSSHKHFLQMLPDDLALRHLRRFGDHPLAPMLSKPEAAATALYRSGRALSYHDFELDFCGGAIDLVAAADGYHPLLLDLQPPSRSELDLQRYFDDNHVGCPRAFSRSWIDLLLRKGATSSVPRSVRMVRPHVSPGVDVIPGKQFWNLDLYVCRQGEMTIELPALAEGSKAVLLVDAGAPDSGVDVRVDRQRLFAGGAARLQRARPPTWHNRFVIPLPPARTGSLVQVRPATGSTHACIAGVLIDQ